MKKAAALLFIIAPLASSQAAILWDQYDVNTAAPTTVDQEFPVDFTQYSTYQVNDVTVGGGGWHVTTVSGLFQLSDPSIWHPTEGILNVYVKTGSLPSNEELPDFGQTVTISTTGLGNGVYEISASGLNLDLSPGDYWIGLTPVAFQEANGQAFRYQTLTQVGDPNALRNTPGGFNVGMVTFQLAKMPRRQRPSRQRRLQAVSKWTRIPAQKKKTLHKVRRGIAIARETGGQT